MKTFISLYYQCISFKTEIKTNLKLADFLDFKFNLSSGYHSPYRNTNHDLSYVNISSNHPPQIIKMLPCVVNEVVLKIYPMKLFLTAQVSGYSKNFTRKERIDGTNSH